MKKRLLILITGLEAVISCGQTTTFQKIYGNGYAAGKCVEQTAEGGLIIAGSMTDTVSGNQDIYIVRVDANGTLQWAKTFGDTLPEEGYVVKQIIDGGFIIAGEQYNAATKSDIYLAKTDSSGTLLWAKIFGGTNDDHAYAIEQTTDGGFVIAGNTKSFGAGNDDVYLIKTDVNGTLLWTKTFGGTQSDVSSSIIQTTDKGFIISGGTQSFGAGGQDIYLVKTDSLGNLKWTKTFGGTLNDGSLSCSVTKDQGYIIVGGTSSFGAGGQDVYLVKTDSNGTFQWAKAYGGTKQDVAYSVEQSVDGGYIISGMTRGFGSSFNADAYVIKTDSAGALHWSRTFGGTNDETAYAVVQTNDGGFAAAGSTGSFGYNMYLIKTSSIGNSGCNDSLANTIVNSAGGTQGTGGIQGTGGTAGVPFAQTNNGGIETTLCSTSGIKQIIPENRFTVFPNPFSTQTTLQTDDVLTNATVRIENCLGQAVKQINLSMGQAGNGSGRTVILNCSDLQEGIYFLHLLENNSVIATKKLIISDY